jgi:hypothetical protein
LAHDPLFDSAWAKWAQGVKHFHALQDDIGSFNTHHDRGPVLDARTKYHANRHGFVVAVERIEPIPVSWSLMLGDAANNFRAALDHLAWALTIRGRTAPGSGRLTKRQENAIYFPICQNRAEFNAAIRLPPTPKSLLKLPGIRRADSAKLRRHQPYRHGPGMRPFHPLTMLANVNTGDKHRTIQPVWIEPAVIQVQVSKERSCVIGSLGARRWRKKPLKPGTELAYIPARRTGPEPQIEVQVKVAAEPSIGRHITVQEWGARIAARLSIILLGFSEPPQELIESIADVTRLVATVKALEAAGAARWS